YFFFQAEDGIRDFHVTGVQTCALPISQLNDPEAIRRLLVDTEVWAIVGLGANPHRPAYSVARFLQERGKRIVPVHPTAATVHGRSEERRVGKAGRARRARSYQHR